MHTSPSRPARDVRPWSGAAIASLGLGIAAVISTIGLGLGIIIPIAATLVGAVALRVTHTKGLRGRPLAMWGFWLGAGAFLLQAAILILALIGHKL